MRTKILVLSIILCLSILCIGCSYTEVEKKIKEDIGVNESPPQVIPQKEVKENEIIYLQIGDVIPSYYAYTNEFGELDEYGTEGLEYKINNVSVYDSFYSSDINLDECDVLYDGEDKQAILENNRFVLVDFTATYKNETGDKNLDSVIWSMDFSPQYRWGSGYDEIEVDFPDKCEPTICYFDKHCKDGDIDMNGQELSIEKNYYICSNPIKSGESVDFQIGLYCSKEYIKKQNLFLGEYFSEPPSDEPIYYIDLLGRYKK